MFVSHDSCEATHQNRARCKNLRAVSHTCRAHLSHIIRLNTSSLLLLLLLELIDRESKGLSPILRALLFMIALADGLALATGFASANASPCHHATLPLATGFALAYRDGKRWLALATGVALATGLAVSTGFALETAVANVAFFSAAFSTAALAELLNLASSACRRAA